MVVYNLGFKYIEKKKKLVLDCYYLNNFKMFAFKVKTMTDTNGIWIEEHLWWVSKIISRDFSSQLFIASAI